MRPATLAPGAMPEPSWLRRGGQGRGPDGGSSTWIAAEGARGRRWREVRGTAGGTLGLLLELEPSGRWSRLEMTAGSGLLTLHPNPPLDELHGNVVTASGIRHLAFPWEPEHVVLAPGSVVCLAVLARALEGVVGGGERRRVRGVRIEPSLNVEPAMIDAARLEPGTWRIGVVGAATEEVRLDAEGWPIVAGSTSWPLEIEVGELPSVDAVWTTPSDRGGSRESRG